MLIETRPVTNSWLILIGLSTMSYGVDVRNLFRLPGRQKLPDVRVRAMPPTENLLKDIRRKGKGNLCL